MHQESPRKCSQKKHLLVLSLGGNSELILIFSNSFTLPCSPEDFLCELLSTDLPADLDGESFSVNFSGLDFPGNKARRVLKHGGGGGTVAFFSAIFGTKIQKFGELFIYKLF